MFSQHIEEFPMKSVCKSFVYLSFPLATLAVVNGVRAQSITPDNSLGNENSVVNTNVDVGKGIPSDRIDGGATRGNNLFHSFSNFNVDAGRGAYFSNPAGIENIISRVTGSNVSNILGTLGVLGNANLFFANPNGIVFGPDARLDVSGSFFATTSDGFSFDNGFEFSASNPQAPPLLTINIPIGLRFRDNPGSITIGDSENNPTPQSPSFQVQPEKTLAFVGGEINLNGRRLRAPGGRIELGALAAQGTVGINNDLSLSFPDGVARADVSLNASDVDVTSGDKGSVSINARNINIRGGSDICVGIGTDGACGGLATNPGSVGSQAGDINLTALETITIADSGSSVNHQVNFNAIGNSGNINIRAENLFLNDGGSISASIFGLGNSGNININVRDNVSLDGGFIFNNVLSGAVGNSGGTNITTGSLSAINGATIASATLGLGNSGNININVRDNVSLDGGFILNNVLSGAVGNSGGINITTGSLSAINGAAIESTTLGQGNSANININAGDNVSFDNSLIISNIGNDAFGNSGNININTGSLTFANGTRVESVTFGQGKSGNVTFQVDSFKATNNTRIVFGTVGQEDSGDLFIKATQLVEVLGTEEPGKSSSISARVIPGGNGDGNAGDLTIETKKLVIRNSQVGNSTFGNGNAGNLTVKASESVEIIGKVFSENIDNPTQPIRNPAGLFSQVNVSGVGNGGNLTVETQRLSIGNGGKIQVAVFGVGNAGNLTIKADDIDIFDTPGKADFFQGGIFAGFQVDEDETTVPPSGDFGGTITIKTDRLRVRDGGAITVLTEGNGDAGVLKINAKEFIEVSGKVTTATTNQLFTSKISAEATEESTGNGGTVKLNTNTLIVRDGGLISAASLGIREPGDIGEPGDIEIQVEELLLLRRGAQISTLSAQDNDNTSNIKINTGILVAFPEENSDIAANAGGVEIFAQGIFGIVPRNSLTPFSDITARTEIAINNLEVDPIPGLIELPETIVDAKNQIAQNACRQGFGSGLVATGRGGLPPSPTQDLRSSAVRVGLTTPVASNTTNTTARKPKPTPTVKKIVPAQGWIFNSKGQVVLTAYNPNHIGVQRTAHKALCREK